MRGQIILARKLIFLRAKSKLGHTYLYFAPSLMTVYNTSIIITMKLLENKIQITGYSINRIFLAKVFG